MDGPPFRVLWRLTIRSLVDGPTVSTAGYVKLLLPPRQSRGNSYWRLVTAVHGYPHPPDAFFGNLVFRWFVGLSPDDPIWDPTVFTKNRAHTDHEREISRYRTARQLFRLRPGRSACCDPGREQLS